jgi:hypothetical protein
VNVKQKEDISKTTITLKKNFNKRFIVVMVPFSASAVTLFKHVNGFKYDGESRTWSFPVDQRKVLLRLLGNFKIIEE